MRLSKWPEATLPHRGPGGFIVIRTYIEERADALRTEDGADRVLVGLDQVVDALARQEFLEAQRVLQLPCHIDEAQFLVAKMFRGLAHVQRELNHEAHEGYEAVS